MRAIANPILTAVLFVSLAGAAACSDDGDKAEVAGKGSTEGGAASIDQVAALAGEANGALPDELGESIAFSAQKMDDDRIAVLVPDGWAEGAVPGSLRPPDDAGLGFMTRYTVGTNCDGTCEPKDWAAAAAKDFAQFEGEQFEILSDEPLEGGGRLLVAKSGDRAYVAGARWKDGASRYATCSANLDGKAAAAVEAFTHACRSLQVLSW